MLPNLGRLLVHFVGAALACAQLAYWGVQLLTPASSAAPAPLRAAAFHDPDPVLLGRAFGEVEHAATALANIQLAGVFAAGQDSAAVFLVGDLPARAVRLGQEVAPGSTLVGVDPLGVTLESGGVRRQLRVPNVQVAGLGGPGAGRNAGFERRGNVLTAPMVEGSPAPASRAAAPGAAPAAPGTAPLIPRRGMPAAPPVTR
jgi:general secretion pathway protein C